MTTSLKFGEFIRTATVVQAARERKKAKDKGLGAVSMGIPKEPDDPLRDYRFLVITGDTLEYFSQEQTPEREAEFLEKARNPDRKVGKPSDFFRNLYLSMRSRLRKNTSSQPEVDRK